MALGTVRTSNACKVCGQTPQGSLYYQSGIGYLCGPCFFGPEKAPADAPITPLVRLA